MSCCSGISLVDFKGLTCFDSLCFLLSHGIDSVALNARFRRTKCSGKKPPDRPKSHLKNNHIFALLSSSRPSSRIFGCELNPSAFPEILDLFGSHRYFQCSLCVSIHCRLSNQCICEENAMGSLGFAIFCFLISWLALVFSSLS